MLSTIFGRIKNIFDLDTDSSKISTIEQINKDVHLRGPNIVYLICSAILTSVGLDINSPAVIIGAMLISPLMSPILGIGLSVGIQDKESFFTSLRVFSISVLVSLLVSTLYFILSPLGNTTSEILARIKPTALDIIIAFFGGMAGIVAITRSKMAAVIPGVAIATALMPPICTAGYGLASAQFEYFFGAIYLFFINTVFISFSSYLIVRYLKFPFKEYLDSKRLLRTKIIISVFVTLVAIPSFIIFYSVIKDVRANKNLEKFVKEQIQQNNLKVIEWKFIAQKNNPNILSIYVVGSKMTTGRKDSLNNSLGMFGIENTKIDFTQLSDDKGIEFIKGELSTDILSKIKLIRKSEAENETDSLKNALKQDSIKVQTVLKDLIIFIPEIDNIGFSQNFYNSSTVNDTLEIKKIPMFTINWKKNTSTRIINSRQNELYQFLKNKIQSDTINIVNLK